MKNKNNKIFKSKPKEQIIGDLKKLSLDDMNKILINAAQYGHIGIVELLLNVGADINAKDEYGWSTLMSAADNGHKDVIELLVKAGADVNAKTNGGWSALMLAVDNGRKDIVELLKRYGAKE